MSDLTKYEPCDLCDGYKTFSAWHLQGRCPKCGRVNTGIKPTSDKCDGCGQNWYTCLCSHDDDD